MYREGVYSNDRDCQVLSEASRGSQKRCIERGCIVMIETVKCCLRAIERFKNRYSREWL